MSLSTQSDKLEPDYGNDITREHIGEIRRFYTKMKASNSSIFNHAHCEEMLVLCDMAERNKPALSSDGAIHPSDEAVMYAKRALDPEVTTWSHDLTLTMAQEILRLSNAAPQMSSAARPGPERSTGGATPPRVFSSADAAQDAPLPEDGATQADKERLWDTASMLEYQAKLALDNGKMNVEIDAQRIVPQIVAVMKKAAGPELTPSATTPALAPSEIVEAIFDEHYCDEWAGGSSYTSAESLRTAIQKAFKAGVARSSVAPQSATARVDSWTPPEDCVAWPVEKQTLVWAEIDVFDGGKDKVPFWIAPGTLLAGHPNMLRKAGAVQPKPEAPSSVARSEASGKWCENTGAFDCPDYTVCVREGHCTRSAMERS